MSDIALKTWRYKNYAIMVIYTYIIRDWTRISHIAAHICLWGVVCVPDCTIVYNAFTSCAAYGHIKQSSQQTLITNEDVSGCKCSEL